MITKELNGFWPKQEGSACKAPTRDKAPSIWSLGICLVSLVPCVGDDLVVIKGYSYVILIARIRLLDLAIYHTTSLLDYKAFLMWCFFRFVDKANFSAMGSDIPSPRALSALL